MRAVIVELRGAKAAVLAQDVDGALVRLEAEGRLRLARGPGQPAGHGREDTGSGHCADAADTGTR